MSFPGDEPIFPRARSLFRSFALRDWVFKMNIAKGLSHTARDVALKWDDLLEREVVVGDHTSDCTGHFCHRNNCDLCGNETDEAPCRFCGLTFCGDCQRRGYQYLIQAPCRFCGLTFCGDCQRRGYQYLFHCECTTWC